MRTSATRGLLSLGFLILLSAATVQANPIVIDFEDGTAGNAIGSFYAGLGVTFSNAQFVSASGFPGLSNLGFNGVSGPGPSNPIIINFAALQSVVTLTAVDLSQQGFLLRAFDANGGFLGQAGFASGAPFGVPITFSVTTGTRRISFVEIFQPLNLAGTSGGVVFDNLKIDNATDLVTVPEPATLLLLSGGLVAPVLAAYRRRKVHKDA
jgi:hypothetical protein